MNSLRNKNGALDAIDGLILLSLVEDARISTAEIARKVSLSPPSVAERIRRLEEAGIITGYTASIDPRALGLELAAWIRIRPMPGQFHNVAKILNGLPAVVECDRITGEDCFIVCDRNNPNRYACQRPCSGWIIKPNPVCIPVRAGISRLTSLLVAKSFGGLI